MGVLKNIPQRHTLVFLVSVGLALGRGVLYCLRDFVFNEEHV